MPAQLSRPTLFSCRTALPSRPDGSGEPSYNRNGLDEVIRWAGAVLLLSLTVTPASPKPPRRKKRSSRRRSAPSWQGTCFKCHGGAQGRAAASASIRATPCSRAATAARPSSPARPTVACCSRPSATTRGLRLEDAARTRSCRLRSSPTSPPGSTPGRVWPAAARPSPTPSWPESTGPSSRSRPSAAARPGRLVDNPIDRFVAQRRRAAGLRPVGPADRRTLLRRVTFDLIGLPPTPEEIARLPRRRLARRLRQGRRPPAGLAALRRALGPALDGRGPLRRHRRRQRRLPGPGGPPAIAITSSTRSTPTSPTTSSSASNWPATSWPAGAAGAATPSAPSATGVPGPVAPLRDGPLRALAPDARRHDRHDRPGLPRPDAALRPLPRPQVRPGHPARLLRPLRHLRQHALPLRRLRGVRLDEAAARVTSCRCCPPPRPPRS